jgi:hypothetical protein
MPEEQPAVHDAASSDDRDGQITPDRQVSSGHPWERQAAVARILRDIVEADDPSELVGGVDEERAELRLGEPGRGFGDRFD